MNIYVDYEGLSYASDYISKLKNTAIVINATLSESKGSANDSEKAIIELLSEICSVSFPAMLDSTKELIQTIIAGFKNADESFPNGAVSGIAGIVSGAAQTAVGAMAGAAASALANSVAGALAGAAANGSAASATGGDAGK